MHVLWCAYACWRKHTHTTLSRTRRALHANDATQALALATLSDWYGRRPLLLLCMATQCIGSLGTLLVVQLQLSLWWFAPFFAVNGAGGASWVYYVLILAVLGDTVSAPLRCSVRLVLTHTPRHAYYTRSRPPTPHACFL